MLLGLLGVLSRLVPISDITTEDEIGVEQDEKLCHTRILPPSRLLTIDCSVLNNKKEDESFVGVSFMMMDFDNGRNFAWSN